MRDSSPGKDLRMFLVYCKSSFLYPEKAAPNFEFASTDAEEFNYARHAISTRNGGQLLPKSTYGWSFRSNSDQLVIQDPTDPSTQMSPHRSRNSLILNPNSSRPRCRQRPLSPRQVDL